MISAPGSAKSHFDDNPTECILQDYFKWRFTAKGGGGIPHFDNSDDIFNFKIV